MRVMFSIWMNIVITQVGGKINKFSFRLCYSRNGKGKYMTHSIITKLFSVLMDSCFFFKFWGPFLLSTTDSSPGFTQLRSGKIAMDYRLRKTYF